jgi:BirA family transcriptional regulator, biotin operon repressor / biotin---[acetyl-CoA-carboxylase] ligase
LQQWRLRRLSGSWPAGVGRVVLETVTSTNAVAAGMAPGPAWVLGLEQTAGRGRRARAWASPRGNFHGSLVMAPAGTPAQVALRSFAAALALRDAFARVTGGPEAFGLKWPNDVLCNGGKVAGILLESVSSGAGVAHLVIGIGVNLIAAPDAALLEPGAVPAVTLLGETGKRVTPETFLDALAPAYAVWEDRLTTDGFAPLRSAWLAHAAHLGQPIRARTGIATHHGTFQTVDDSGALILQTAQGRLAIPAAEVFF